MPQIGSISRPGRLPIEDGRSAELRFLRRISAELIAQCGGEPTASQRLLIDRVAVISLRIQLIDRDPLLPDREEYLALIRLMAELLAQLGTQPAAPNIVRPSFCEVAA